MGIDLTRSIRGAVAGAIAAGVWAAQEPLDRRVFGVPYSDPLLLGTGVLPRASSRAATAAGWALHVANGAAFGAAYAKLAPSIPVPPAARGPLAGIAEHAATWPLTPLVPRLHPAAGRHPRLWGSGAALAQATWRHLLFGVVLGEIERRLNPPEPAPAVAPEPVVESNGHGEPGRIAVVR